MISQIFSYHDPARTEDRKRIYAAFELWYTLVDVGAAVSFLTGSLLFSVGKHQDSRDIPVHRGLRTLPSQAGHPSHA